MEEQSSPLEAQIDLAPASWPKIVGILSIVWASLGLTCLVCGVGMQVGLGVNMLPPEVRDNPPPNMRFGMLQVIQTLMGLVSSALLLVAGIQTARRSFNGRTLHLVWGWFSVLSLIYGTYIGWRTNQETLVWARNNPDSDYAKQTLAAAPFTMVLTVAIVAFFGIWPFFCLIWFGLVKRTKESFGAPPNADFI